MAVHATQLAFENYAPLPKYVTKIHGTTIDDAEDSDLVMLIYNLLEYRSNCSDMTGSLWFYSKDESTNVDNNIANANNFKSLGIRLNY